jgi:hypothetical protein
MIFFSLIVKGYMWFFNLPTFWIYLNLLQTHYLHPLSSRKLHDNTLYWITFEVFFFFNKYVIKTKFF